MNREAIKVQPGDHVCVMRENREGVPFTDDLKDNEFLLYVGDQAALKKMSSMRQNQIECTSFEDFAGDTCDPDTMISALVTYVKKAEELGFSSLRVIQDMAEITLQPEQHRTYEAKINMVCAEHKILCVCCYDTTFPEDALLTALKTHPLVFVEGELCRNVYYTAPELLLTEEQSVVAAYIENIIECHQIEKKLKESSKKKIDQLKESEKKYKALVEHVPDVVYLLDSTGHLIEVNPAVTLMLGFSQEELIGEHFSKVVCPDDIEKASQSFGNLVEGKKEKTIGLQLHFLTKTGEIKIGELSARGVYDTKGTLVRTEGIVRDITKRLEQKENMEFLAGVVENVMEAVVITSRTGVVTYVNPAACSMFGYAREELLGESASMLHSRNSPVTFQEVLEHAQRGWEGEILAIRKNGQRFPLWMRTSALQNERGAAVITVSRDITEQKEAEEKLQRYALLLEMKVREKTKGTETLLKTSYALRSTSNWKKGTETITRGIVEGLGFDSAAVFFVNEYDRMLECKGQLNISEKLLRVKVPLTDDRYALVKCVTEKRPILVKDAQTDPRVEAHLEGEAGEFVWVPILFQSDVLGALGADRRKSKTPIETEDVDIMELYANQIAEFIERTRLVVEPEEEKQVSTPLKYDLELQDVYLIEEERPERAYDMFTDLVKHGFKGFGICRTHPEKIREKYALKKTPVMWLSEIEGQQVEHVGPQDVPKLVYLVTEFMKRAQPAVVIVEGVEYLVIQNDFKTVLKVLHSLSDYVATSQSVLLLPVNPDALPKHQYVLLKSAFRVIPQPDTKKK
jgi:PAS domain S-box-containing protein